MNNRLTELLFNPFGRIAGMKAFAIGIVVVAVTVVTGYLSGTIFTGVASVHLVSGLSFGSAAIGQTVSLLVTIAVMYIMAVILAKNVRFRDFLGTVTLSRHPFFFAAIPGFFITAPDTEEIMQGIADGTFRVSDTGNMGGLLVAGIIIMLLALWAFILLFNAYRVSSGLKGPRLYWSFAASVIITALISNISLYYLSVR